MADLTPIPHSLLGWVQLALAAFLGYCLRYLPALITFVYQRLTGKAKTDAEVDNTEAETIRLGAEARNLELRNVVHASRALQSMLESVEAVTLRFERKTAEVDHWRVRYEDAEKARRILESELALANKNLDLVITVGKPSEPLQIGPALPETKS